VARTTRFHTLRPKLFPTLHLFLSSWSRQGSFSRCTEFERRVAHGQDGSSHQFNGRLRGTLIFWPDTKLLVFVEVTYRDAPILGYNAH
jgi:hypothetical protein